MNLLIASGGNKRSEAWAEQVAEVVEPLYDDVEMLRYEHWQQENGQADLELESHRLTELARRSPEDYAIFAKSFGTLATLKAIHELTLVPRYCVFVGIPFNQAKKESSIIEWLKGYRVPTLFIQASGDPYISYDELDAVLVDRDVRNHELVEFPADDHNYSDVNLLKRHVARFAQHQSVSS